VQLRANAIELVLHKDGGDAVVPRAMPAR